MKTFTILLFALLSLCVLGCDSTEFDRVAVRVRLINSSDSLRRQVELSDVTVTLASSVGTPQPAGAEKTYTNLPVVIVNASNADSEYATWHQIYNSHEVLLGDRWIDPTAATTPWNEIEPQTATVRITFKKIDSPIYCSYTGPAAVETTVGDGYSYTLSCHSSDIGCDQNGERTIDVARDIAHLVTIDISRATCSETD